MLQKASAFAVLVIGTAVILSPALAAPNTAGVDPAMGGTSPATDRAAGRRFAAARRAAWVGRGQARYRGVTRWQAAAQPSAPTKGRKPLVLPPQEEDLSTASIVTAALQPDLERMRGPLEARAQLLADDTPLATLPAPERARPAALPAPSAVSFDLRRGVKTVTFEDDVAVTVSVDPAEARQIANLRPGRP